MTYNTKEIVFTTEIGGAVYRVFPKYTGVNLPAREAKDRVRQSYLGKGEPFVPVTTSSDREGVFVDYIPGRGTLWSSEVVDVPANIKMAIENLDSEIQSDEPDEATVANLKATLRNYFSRG